MFLEQKKHLITFLLLFCLCTTFQLYGQTDEDVIQDQNQLIEDYIDQLGGEEDFDFNTLFDELTSVLNNPLDLNNIAYDQLEQLRYLNEIQINAILNHRDRFGPFLSLLELQTIPSLSNLDVQNILPFFKEVQGSAFTNQSVSEALARGRWESYTKFRRVLEDQRGFVKDQNGDSKYQGDPYRLYTRWRYSSKILNLGITAEKDPGEHFFRGANKQGFDFYSAYLELNDISESISKVILGDYSVSLGQGLILHNGFGANKSSYVMNIKRGGKVIRPYSSVNETNFFRGAAVQLDLSSKLGLSLFGSYNALDANIIELDTTDIESNESTFSSIVTNGFHRTENEIEDRNSIYQSSTGAKLSVNTGRLQLGLNVLHQRFDKKFERRIRLDNQFQFRGQALTNASIDYSSRVRNFTLFGEVAASDNGSVAHNHGLLLGLNKFLDLAVHFRDYSPSYHSINSNAFGELSSASNEKGMYMGVYLRPASQWSISAYADLWQHDWLSFRRDAPARGQEYLIKAQYSVRNKLSTYVQFRRETKDRNSQDPIFIIDQTTPILLQRLRFHLDYSISKGLKSRSRMEFSYFKSDTEEDEGILIYQDLLYRPEDSKFSVNGRFAWFSIDDFDNRIYTFERDMIYEYNIPFYYDDGIRYYLNLRYDLTKNITSEFRLSQTRFSNLEEIGSGNDTIEGSKRTEIKAQVRLRF